MSPAAKTVIVVLAVALAGLLLVGGCFVVAGLYWFTPARSFEPPPAVVAKAPVAVSEGMGFADATEPAMREAGPAPDPATLPERREAAIQRGLQFLLAQQAKDGAWGDGNVGITALCTLALLEGGMTSGDAPVQRGIACLLQHQHNDGGIYDVGLKNYTTSIALMVLVKAQPTDYAIPIRRAKGYLLERQWDEPESIDKNHAWYGGAGYGKHERPDLSNTAYFLEALHEAGIPKDHPVWAKAAVFLSRTQDRSESNAGVFVGTDSGGFIYTPHGGGESKAGTVDLPGGQKGLKAYASMTYAGFKSFIYADLDRDDPRVQAALDWIRRHWSFEENPELGDQGLYYYYQTAAKALQAWGEDTILDARQHPHDWRHELAEAVLARQQDDGSWVNDADRWFEGYPPVPTSYAVIALAACR